jgi:parallel beta-helix repeat protein
MSMVRPGLSAFVALAAVVATAATSAGAGVGDLARPKNPCNRAASPAGDDGAAGTPTRPFESVERLVDALRPGEVGCLLGGTFSEHVVIRRGGSPGRPITLRSAPGRRARLVGTLDVGTSDIVIAGLRLDGRGRASPQVNGVRITFRGNEITNEEGICVILGAGFESGYDRARSVVIDRNRIHNCGRLPPTGHDHGIYVEGTNGVRITNNFIYDNADYGIHLYPDAQGTYVARNVIDGNGGGVIFAGEDSGGEYDRAYASRNNVVRNNVISNSRVSHNIESWWGGPAGSGNIATRNCLWNGADGNVSDEVGFRAAGNIVARPIFRDRRRGDLRLKPRTACSRILSGRS